MPTRERAPACNCRCIDWHRDRLAYPGYVGFTENASSLHTGFLNWRHLLLQGVLMQKALLFKTIIVAGLMFLIGVPLMMIQSTISERMSFRNEAVRSIAADSVREQSLIGPVLVIPYTDEFINEQVTDGTTQKVKAVRQVINKRLLVFPNDLQIKGNIDTDQRYRGIHKVLTYSGKHEIAGDFILPKKEDLEKEKPDSKVSIGKPFIALSVDDVRGILNIPKINWDGKPFEFQQGSGLMSFKNGLHAPLDTFEWKESASVKFAFDLGLDGIERINITPIGKNNKVTLSSPWPHPQFGGRFLPSPKSRTIDSSGFSATWNISALATNAQQQLIRLEQGKLHGDTAAIGTDALDSFNVGFIEPINIYSQADRAVKYGILFVALTFSAFFLFEILKQLPIHPVQYTLVGLALAIFFLLLVSLSEHMDFMKAYLLASCACITLTGFYLAHALRSWQRGFGFGVALTLLYSVLYGLLQSESNALIMGSILLFSVLSAIMIATRNVDWYQIGKSGNPGNPGIA
jgi:inner membrane protein